jgi:hypothetical protein
VSGAYPMPDGDPAALYHLADQLDGAGGTVAGLADRTATVTVGIRD